MFWFPTKIVTFVWAFKISTNKVPERCMITTELLMFKDLEKRSTPQLYRCALKIFRRFIQLYTTFNYDLYLKKSTIRKNMEQSMIYQIRIPQKR